MRSRATAVVSASMLVALTACSAPPAGEPRASASAFELPPVSGVFDYQLAGVSGDVQIDGEARAVTVLARDSGAEPLEGAYCVCYINGFQTQPQDGAMWQEHPDLLLRDAQGRPVVDPDWPDEFILDPSTEGRRADILALMQPSLDDCSGFDAVEIDNLDTFTRFPGVSEAGAMALARSYIDSAHARGLAVAQKNAAELTDVAHRELGFDFAVAEECAAYGECDAYTAVYGRHVLQVEYQDSLDAEGVTFEEACAESGSPGLTILRDRGLVSPGDEGYLYRAC